MFLQGQVAVESVSEIDNHGIRVLLSGIRAKPMRGLIRPTIDMREVDIYETSLVIHNIPVLGTYSVDLRDPDNEQLRLRCGEGT